MEWNAFFISFMLNAMYIRKCSSILLLSLHTRIGAFYAAHNNNILIIYK